MADETLIIDDRRSSGLESTLGNNWRIITGVVMGGLSSGELSLPTALEKNWIFGTWNASVWLPSGGPSPLTCV